MEVEKPVWTPASFLLYLGGLTVLIAALGSLGYTVAASASPAYCMTRRRVSWELASSCAIGGPRSLSYGFECGLVARGQHTSQVHCVWPMDLAFVLGL